MKYRRVEADSHSISDSCHKCCFEQGGKNCTNTPCELSDENKNLIPFYFIEEPEVSE